MSIGAKRRLRPPGRTMKQVSKEASKLYHIVMAEAQYWDVGSTRYDLNLIADEMLAGGFLPKGDDTYADKQLDIKLALYSDDYLEKMLATYKQGLPRTESFKILLDVYARNVEKPHLLDRIEQIYAALRNISDKGSAALFVINDHQHPRFVDRMNDEMQRWGVCNFLIKMTDLYDNDVLLLLHNWIHPESQTDAIADVKEDHFAGIMAFMRQHCDLDEIVDLTTRDQNSAFQRWLHPLWAKQFSLDDLIERYMFNDVNALFADKGSPVGFELSRSAACLALIKATQCDETKALLKQVPRELIERIREFEILPNSLLVELDWLKPAEKRRHLESELSL